MKPKMVLKIGTDIAMTAALLLLMAYSLIGEKAHEWIGVGMFLLFVLHHILNGKWSSNLLKGKYTVLRIWQTVLVAAVLLCMAGSMISGIVLSYHVFRFLPVHGVYNWARTMHLLCSYWGFVMMSLHLGFHWCMMMAMVKKHMGTSGAIYTWLLRTVAIVIALYGVFAFVHRDFGSYMLLKNEFVFFNFEEPLIFFFLDYLAVMALFVFIGHYVTEFSKHCTLSRRKQ